MFDVWSRPIRPVLVGADSSRARVGLLLADIDGLRRVREQYGRDGASDVVGAVFGVIREIVGPLGLMVDRISPEDDEFAVFSTAFPDGALTHLTAERIRAGVARLRLPTGPLNQQPPIVIRGVTVSVGYALSPPGAQAVNVGLLAWAARSALAAAKTRTNAVQRCEHLTLHSL